MILVEVLGRRGDVVQRVRLERLPALIGRGWQCDVIVGDPLMDAEHARIVEDGQGRTAVEDAGSRNGLFAGTARRRVDRVAVEGVTTVRVGRTLLRIVPAGATVPPALPDTEAGDRLALLLASPRWIAGALAVGLAAAAVVLWLGSTESHAVSMAGGELLGLFILSVLWAGFWALVGRANVQRFSFWPHLALTWLFLLAVGALGLVAGYAMFLWPGGPFDVIAVLVVLALAAVLFARHLALATLLPRLRRNAAAAGTVAFLLVLALLAGRIAGEADEDATVTLSVSLKPVPARLVPASGLEAFLHQSDDLKRELDRLQGAN